MEAIQETGERAAGAVTIIFWQAISGPSRRKLTAHQNIAMKIYPKTSPPVCRVGTGRPNVSTGRQSEFCLDSRFSLKLIRLKPCGGKGVREGQPFIEVIHRKPRRSTQGNRNRKYEKPSHNYLTDFFTDVS